MSEEIDKTKSAHRLALAIDSLIAHRINLFQCSDINFTSEHAKNVGKAVDYLAECIKAALSETPADTKKFNIDRDCMSCGGEGVQVALGSNPDNPTIVRCLNCNGSWKKTTHK